jgi:hypothetical protein
MIHGAYLATRLSYELFNMPSPFEFNCITPRLNFSVTGGDKEDIFALNIRIKEKSTTYVS